MADFKTHIITGGIFGGLTSVALVGNSFDLDTITLFTIPLITSIGSALPDLDSDTSIPFTIAINCLALFVSLGSLISIVDDFSNFGYIYLLIPLNLYMFIRYVVGYLIKRITKHRGVFHSMPATILTFILTFLALDYLELSHDKNLIFSSALAIGYLSHLILDLVYDFGKKGFSALSISSGVLKWYSKDRLGFLTIYALLIATIVLNWGKLEGLQLF